MTENDLPAAMSTPATPGQEVPHRSVIEALEQARQCITNSQASLPRGPDDTRAGQGRRARSSRPTSGVLLAELVFEDLAGRVARDVIEQLEALGQLLDHQAVVRQEPTHARQVDRPRLGGRLP